MKCQKCHKAATLHITEILSDDQFEELHLCEECAHKYLYEPQQKATGAKAGAAGHGEEADEAGVLNQRVPDLRHQVRRFPQHRPARLPARLPGVPRGTDCRCWRTSTARRGTAARRRAACRRTSRRSRS